MMTSSSAECGVPEESALWLRFDAGSVRLMARFGVHPAALVLSRDQYFEVNVLRKAGTLFVVQPLSVMKYKEMLNDAFSEVARRKTALLRPESISLDKIYFAFTAGFSEQLFGRVAPIKNVKDSDETVMVYNVDSGEYLKVVKENLFEVPRCMQEIPALVFLAKAFDGSSAESKEIPLKCRIRDRRIGSPHGQADGDYPPYIVCEISEGCIDERNRRPKLSTVDVIAAIRLNLLLLLFLIAAAPTGCFTGFCRRSTDITSFFPRFEYNAPHSLDVRIARKVSFDVYSVLNISVLQKLSENVIQPKKRLTNPFDDGVYDVACIAHVARPSKPGLQPSRLRFYRAIASRIETSADTCRIYLIDYDQQVIGSIHALYDIAEQPQSVRSLPVAAFRLNVTGILPLRSGVKTVKLEAGRTYNVSLTGNDGTEHMGTVSVPFAHVVQSTVKLSDDNAQQRKKSERKKVAAGGTEDDQEKLTEDEDIKMKDISRNSEKDRFESISDVQKELSILDQNKSRCEEELALAAIQLQCAHLSRQLDTLTIDVLRGNRMMPPPFYGSGNAGMLIPPAWEQFRWLRPPGLTPGCVMPSCLGQNPPSNTNATSAPVADNGLLSGPPPSFYQAGFRPPAPNSVILPVFQQTTGISTDLQKTTGVPVSEMNFECNSGVVTTSGMGGGHNAQSTVAPNFAGEQNFPSTGMKESCAVRNLNCSTVPGMRQNISGPKTEEKNIASAAVSGCKKAGEEGRSREDDGEGTRHSVNVRTVSPEKEKEALGMEQSARARRVWRNRTGRYGVIWRSPTCEICKRDGHFAGSCPEAPKKSLDKGKGTSGNEMDSKRSRDTFGYSLSGQTAEANETNVLSRNRYEVLYTSDDDSFTSNSGNSVLRTKCCYASGDNEVPMDRERSSD